MINIFDKEQLSSVLSKLKADATPLWGKMSPQHVIEHLTQTVKASVGKVPVKLHMSPEDAEDRKQKLIYGDMQLTPGIKHPMMGDEPPALIHSSFNEAIEALHSELNFFDEYYNKNAGIKNIHPRMGELKRSEWEVFHNKHFAHHFRQYGLVD
ncbi:MAG: DUF1569 domain-containing protein [Bacteroidia bacterium]